MIEIPGIGEEWWGQRVRFLVSRAEVHLEQRSEILRHRACAATLLRDAGCLLLLREEFQAGRERLAQAGEQLLEIGLAAGLVLVAMHDARRGQDALGSYRVRVAESPRGGADPNAEWPEDTSRSVEVAARDSFGSMLSVVQAGLLRGAADGDRAWGTEDRQAERRELLERHRARDVGETGMSVFSYLRVAASMEGKAQALDGEAPVELVRAVELLGRGREERIEVARRDQFHWRLVPRPAELLDLDSVVLMQVALASGYDGDVLRDWTGWRKGDVVGAPLDVAEQLRGFS